MEQLRELEIAKFFIDEEQAIEGYTQRIDSMVEKFKDSGKKICVMLILQDKHIIGGRTDEALV